MHSIAYNRKFKTHAQYEKYGKLSHAHRPVANEIDRFSCAWPLTENTI